MLRKEKVKAHGGKRDHVPAVWGGGRDAAGKFRVDDSVDRFQHELSCLC